LFTRPAPWRIRRATAISRRISSATAVSGKLELAVRDFDFAFFDFAFGPAANGDGKPNLGQLHRHEREIDGLLLSKISLGSPGARCSLEPGPVALDLRGGEYFMILPFSGICEGLGEQVQVGYDVMFDVDAQHRWEEDRNAVWKTGCCCDVALWVSWRFTDLSRCMEHVHY